MNFLRLQLIDKDNKDFIKILGIAQEFLGLHQNTGTILISGILLRLQVSHWDYKDFTEIITSTNYIGLPRDYTDFRNIIRISQNYTGSSKITEISRRLPGLYKGSTSGSTNYIELITPDFRNFTKVSLRLRGIPWNHRQFIKNTRFPWILSGLHQYFNNYIRSLGLKGFQRLAQDIYTICPIFCTSSSQSRETKASPVSSCKAHTSRQA